jgi:RHS repeat-associated protein
MDITDVFGNYVMRDQRKDNAYHNKGYTGHEFDDVSANLYAHSRYLSAPMHSFLSVDPMLYTLPQSYLTDPQQMNSYAYARNNPIIYTDPTGEIAFLPFIMGVAAIINFFVQSTDVAKAPANQSQAQGTSQIDINLNRTKAASNYATVAFTFGTGAIGIASSLKSVGTKTTTAQTTSNGLLSGKGTASNSSGYKVNTVGATTNIETGAVTINRGALQTNVSNSLNNLESKGWNVSKKEVMNGTFKNKEGLLPTTAKYREYDVNPEVRAPFRDAERFVRGDNGKIYYTDDHYQSFMEIVP